MYLINKTGSSYDERNQLSTAFLLARNKAQVGTTSHKQPQTVFSIFVGYLGTAKYLLPLNISMI